MLNIFFLNKHVIFIERKDLETNHRGRELIPSLSCDLKRKFSEEEMGINLSFGSILWAKTLAVLKIWFINHLEKEFRISLVSSITLAIDKWGDDQELGSGKLTLIASPSRITCLLYPNFVAFVASSLAAITSGWKGEKVGG